MSSVSDRAVSRSRGNIFDHGEDGAFHRPDNAFIGRIARFGQGVRPAAASIVSRLSNPGQNRARSARGSRLNCRARPSAHPARPHGPFYQYCSRLSGNFSIGSLHGEQHIRAGIAIWNRENVERIHHLLVGL